MIKKKRPETMIERVERAHHMYDNGPKPKHYEDKKQPITIARMITFQRTKWLKLKVTSCLAVLTCQTNTQTNTQTLKIII